MLAKHPKVFLRDWPYNNGIDEDQFLLFAYDWYPKAKTGGFDWAMWVDCDEFIYAPDVRKVLEESKYDVIRTKGYNMLGDGLPKDDGRSQIWQAHKNGAISNIYSKPVVFRPSIKIRWNRGKHDVEECSGKISHDPMFKLLHYRYMGGKYTAEINARNYARCCLRTGDKNAAWTCAPNFKGEHSADWAEKAKIKALNVVDAPL
jgi:hypothetical protein